MSFVLRKYKWFRATREFRPVSEVANGPLLFFLIAFFFLSSGVVFLFLWWVKMNLRLTLDDNTDFSRPPECEMMMTYNMILSPANDAKWREHESSKKLNSDCEWMTEKWHEHDRMLRAIRKKSHESIVSLVTIDRNLPIQVTLSIYTFKYTHTTLGFTTQWRMRWWMLKWMKYGYGRGDDDSDDTNYDGAVLPYFRQTR